MIQQERLWQKPTPAWLRKRVGGTKPYLGLAFWTWRNSLGLHWDASSIALGYRIQRYEDLTAVCLDVAWLTIRYGRNLYAPETRRG